MGYVAGKNVLVSGGASSHRLSRKAMVALPLLTTTSARLFRGDLTTRDLVSWARWLHARSRLPKPRECRRANPSDETRLLDIGGVRVWWPAEYSTVDLDTVWGVVFGALPLNWHTYEFGPCRLAAGDWVLDAGACEGFFVACALGNGCNVLAVEPVPRLTHCLKKTCARELAAGRVVVANVLLGSSVGHGRLHVGSGPIGAHLSPVGELEVPMLTIDALPQETRLPRIDFLKMDIEGAEPEALTGGLQVLERCRPRLAIAVYHSLTEEAQVRAVLGGSSVTFEVSAKGLLRIGPRFVRQLLLAVPRPA